MKAQAKKTTVPLKAAAAAAKPGAKSATPAAVKTAVKVPVSAKPAAKPAAPSVAKVAPKSAAKTAPLKAAPTPPVAVKAVAAKTKAASASTASPAAAKAAAKPSSKVLPISKNISPIPAAAVAPAAPVAARAGLKAPAPLKPGRRSSVRAAYQSPPPAPMVPTHAPDAAKASYSAMIERVIAPPIHAAVKKDPKLLNNWKTKSAEELTDDEVKAMPDAEYMNEKQLAFFRAKLSVLKQDIHNSAGKTTETLREDTAVVPDPADRATIEEEHALELRTRDRERKLLKKIEQSIARIDSGDYGYCDETGESIGVGRLIARPTANLSLEAQQRRELKQKMFGD